MPNFPCCPGSQQVVAVMSKYIDTFSAAGGDKATVCSIAKNTVDGIKNELSSRDGCPSGGEAQIVNEIDGQLMNNFKMEITYEHESQYNLGYVRAIFDLVFAAAGLLSRCGYLSGKKPQIVEEIDRQMKKRIKLEIINEDECPYNLGFVRAMFDLAAAAAGHADNGTEWQNMKWQFEQESQAIKSFGQVMNIKVTDVHFGHPNQGVSAHQNVPSSSHVNANPGQHSSVANGKDDEPKNRFYPRPKP
ncbi:hypothetical protein niasHS_003103 [Heterodera schachtii]|uniref:Uncharacterized protein n=1 Tax=Heterodera schachtii TaxID=97005 RepID=A0ABD2K9P1_HETSC